jgi:hypothetical protein
LSFPKELKELAFGAVFLLSHLFEFLCSFLGQQKSRPSQIDEVDQAGIISLGNGRQARMRLRSPWLRLELLPMGNKLLAKAIDITKKATQAHGRESRGLVKLNGNILLFSLQKHPPTYPELTLL